MGSPLFDGGQPAGFFPNHQHSQVRISQPSESNLLNHVLLWDKLNKAAHRTMKSKRTE